MSKSLVAIGAFGAGGCLLLSWMMQYLLGVQTERERPPLALLLDAECEHARVGPVRVVEVRHDGRLALTVQVRVRGDVVRHAVAEMLGAAAWQHALGLGKSPSSVVVEVDDGRGHVATMPIARPGAPAAAAPRTRTVEGRTGPAPGR